MTTGTVPEIALGARLMGANSGKAPMIKDVGALVQRHHPSDLVAAGRPFKGAF